MMKNEDVKWGAGLFVPEEKIIFEQEVGSGKYGRVFKAHVYGTPRWKFLVFLARERSFLRGVCGCCIFEVSCLP